MDAPIPSERFEDYYTLNEQIGGGGFGMVYRGTRNDTGEHFAIKVYDRNGMNHERILSLEENVINECRILRDLDHPNIIRFYEVFDNNTQVHIVLELVEGGDLFDRIQRERIESRRGFDEMRAREICRTILKAIAYCHDRNVVHRDLKPENILVVNDGNDIDVKLAGFGFATVLTRDMPGLVGDCGSLFYMAPEILRHNGRQPYGPEVDLWSLGVITYILLRGYPPFRGNNRNDVLSSIDRGGPEFPMDNFGYVSGLGQRFIRSLLNVDPSQRLSARQALDHPWFHAIIEGNENQRSETNAS